MQQTLNVINQIDWLFLVIILIGGRYWGGNFFCVSKNPAINFLFFSAAFSIVWIAIKITVGDFKRTEVESLFITYLFATSFYEILAKKLFEQIEDWISGKKKDENVKEEKPTT